MHNAEKPNPFMKPWHIRMRSGYQHLEAAERLGTLLAYCLEHDHANRHGRPFVNLVLKLEADDPDMRDAPSVEIALATGIDYGLRSALEGLCKAFKNHGETAVNDAEAMLNKGREDT